MNLFDIKHANILMRLLPFVKGGEVVFNGDDEPDAVGENEEEGEEHEAGDFDSEPTELAGVHHRPVAAQVRADESQRGEDAPTRKVTDEIAAFYGTSRISQVGSERQWTPLHDVQELADLATVGIRRAQPTFQTGTMIQTHCSAGIYKNYRTEMIALTQNAGGRLYQQFIFILWGIGRALCSTIDKIKLIRA